MKSQKIQKGGLFNSVDEKGILIKKKQTNKKKNNQTNKQTNKKQKKKTCSKGGVLDHTPNIKDKKELMIPCSYCLQKQCNI